MLGNPGGLGDISQAASEEAFFFGAPCRRLLAHMESNLPKIIQTNEKNAHLAPGPTAAPPLAEGRRRGRRELHAPGRVRWQEPLWWGGGRAHDRHHLFPGTTAAPLPDNELRSRRHPRWQRHAGLWGAGGAFLGNVECGTETTGLEAGGSPASDATRRCGVPAVPNWATPSAARSCPHPRIAGAGEPAGGRRGRAAR